jgi:hypothetical protein
MLQNSLSTAWEAMNGFEKNELPKPGMIYMYKDKICPYQPL